MAVAPLTPMLPETPLTWNVPGWIDAALMASLKLTAIVVPVDTLLAPAAGRVEETVGGVVSAVTGGGEPTVVSPSLPEPPQAAS